MAIAALIGSNLPVVFDWLQYTSGLSMPPAYQ